MLITFARTKKIFFFVTKTRFVNFSKLDSPQIGRSEKFRIKLSAGALFVKLICISE